MCRDLVKFIIIKIKFNFESNREVTLFLLFKDKILRMVKYIFERRLIFYEKTYE